MPSPSPDGSWRGWRARPLRKQTQSGLVAPKLTAGVRAAPASVVESRWPLMGTEQPPVALKALAASGAALTSAVIVNPFDVVKVSSRFPWSAAWQLFVAYA